MKTIAEMTDDEILEEVKRRHAERYPSGCRVGFAHMCEDCGKRLAAQYPGGTLFPDDGPPHLPTMCQHRSGSRDSSGHHRTRLCYAAGTHVLRHFSGAVPGCARIMVAGASIENVRCLRHTNGWAESYYSPADTILVVEL
jgi:hypothetical protein